MKTFQHLKRFGRAWVLLLLLAPFLGTTLAGCQECDAVGVPPIFVKLAAADGQLYLSSYDHLYTLRAGDGKKLWHVQDPLHLYLDAVEADQVYLRHFDGLGTPWTEVRRASDGQVLWSTHEGVLVGLAAGNVYIYNAASKQILALGAGDGLVRWLIPATFSPAALGAPLLSISPQVSDGVLYIASSAGTIGAYRQDDGFFLWGHTFPAPLATDSPWFVGGGVLYLAADQVYALRASDGKVLWSRDPATFVLLGSDQHTLYTLAFPVLSALRTQDGQTVWKKDVSTLISSPDGLGFQQLENTLYFGTLIRPAPYSSGFLSGQAFKQQVFALRTSDGTLLWQARGETLTLAAASGNVYLLSYEFLPSSPSYPPPDASLIARRANDGTILWRQSLPATGMLFAQDTLYTGYGGDGQTTGCIPTGPVVAAKFSSAGGRRLWQVNVPTGT